MNNIRQQILAITRHAHLATLATVCEDQDEPDVWEP